jgi:hypothetical protein
MIGHLLGLRALQKTLSLTRTRVGLHEGEGLTISIFRAPCTAGVGTFRLVLHIVFAGAIDAVLQLKSSLHTFQEILRESQCVLALK